ncbi:general substrate transporter [Lipomyces doorenjongii]|uniref:general substrate transporter n=1 Tax=Lipomyces doorenjongii TaxID=383834 RepID=UPI0034CEFC30
MVRLLNVYTISSFVALGGLLYGFEIASMSDIMGFSHYRAFYGNPLGIRQGVITGAISAGSFFGALSSSVLGDRLSRKVAIQLGTVLWCIGSMWALLTLFASSHRLTICSLQATSTGVPMLIIGRIIAGLCIGITSALVPIYQAEISPRKIRGGLVSVQQFAIGLGLVLQLFIQYGASYLQRTTYVFRLPWAVQTAPAILLFTGLFCFPRTPRWLARQDRWDEVLQVLAFLRTPDCDINHPLVLAEYKEIEEQIRFEREQELNSYRELFGPKMRKRVLLGMAIQAWSQLGGLIQLFYYIVFILRAANEDPNNPNPRRTLVDASFTYIIFTVATIPTILWTDQWGRRSSLLVGALFGAFWMYLIGGLFAGFGQPNPLKGQANTWVIIGHPAAGRTIQASCYLAAATFAMSWGPIEWIYPPEIYPLRIRAKAVSLTTATNWGVNFLLALAVPSLLRTIQWRLYIIFGSFNIGAFIYALFRVRETKQRTLEEMDEVFEHGEPVWRSFTGVRYTGRFDALVQEFERIA